MADEGLAASLAATAANGLPWDPNVDWSKLNQPFGTLTDPNPVLYNTAAGPIYKADVDKATDMALAFSSGGLTTKAVKSLLSRARENLRQALQGYIYMEGGPGAPPSDEE